MEVIELAGSARAMGAAFGESCRGPIHALYAARIANAVEQAADYGGREVDEAWLLRTARRCLTFVEVYAPEGLAELAGIAEGARLELAQVWAMNALTDLRDVAAFTGPTPSRFGDVEGCSSIVVQGTASAAGGTLVGQTWDLSTDNMPFVRVVRRRPSEGPETVALTTVGCLSLIGMNDAGLAVGTTNLRTTDARLGVGYLDVIHRALGRTTFDQARTAIIEAPRAGAHYFYLADGAGRATSFECTAHRCVEVEVHDDFLVHCNHALDPDNAALEARGTAVASTHHRQARLAELASAARPLGPAELRAFFADTAGGALAINRKDFAGISSNGSVVMEPGRGRFWSVHGPADQGRWIELTLPRKAVH